MRKYVLMASLLVSGLSFAQEINPKLEEVDGLVKATYYYDNGVVQQQGFFKDGKLDGKWVSFDESGNKKAEAQYSNGEKVGKWMFWNQDNSVATVDYSEGVIKTKDALADKN
jgi:antitoxin component YwqK of YwqJK toxin-antitoxin module